MKTLTKTGIEKMANEIISLLESKRAVNDVSFFFNNKRITVKKDSEWYKAHHYDENYTPKYIRTETTDINPFDYFDYANPKHIFSMTFEGVFYERINYAGGKTIQKFSSILEKYGVYYELGDAWNLSCFPIKDDLKIEVTDYTPPAKKIYIHNGNFLSYPNIVPIVLKWKEYQDKIGDVGSCVLGAGFNFTKDNQEYFLSPCSRYQGSISWETNVEDIMNLLEEAGYENIYFDYGRMD